MVKAERGKWIESLANYIEAPIAIQQSLPCPPRDLDSETEILEFFFRAPWEGDGLVGECP